jgi:hypothetical protein
MAKSQRRDDVIVFQHSVPVKAQRLKIHRAASLAYLDIAKLDRAARAEFELGHVQVGRCRSRVLAVVRKGKVVGVRGEHCADCRPAKMSPELRDLLKAVRQRINPGEVHPWQPIPVSVFLEREAEEPEKSESWMVCSVFFGGCIICMGFPSDPDSWSCVVITGSIGPAT